MCFFCLDIDECSEMAGACTQFCVNTLGSYICKCAEGYVKTADNRTCKKRDGRFYTFARCIHFYVTVLPRDAVHKCDSNRQVRPSVCNTRVLYQNHLRYKIFFLVLKNHPSSF